MKNTVEKKLKKLISSNGTICLALIDSENISPKSTTKLVKTAEHSGVSGILVGGSTTIDQLELSHVVSNIKQNVKIPVILFPGNVTGISPHADAILFSSLLNSDNPYFIIGAQALAAPVVKKHNLEAIPMGYIIVGDGGSSGFIGRVRGIPWNKPTLAAMYALAAQYLGMRFLYLEAGSGVTSHIPSQIISKVRKVYDGILMVGGGIRTPSDAKELAEAGADIIVIGTLLEEKGFTETLGNIVKSIRNVER